MRCPFCGHLEDKVVDSRQAKDGLSIRRRRECLACAGRFTSYERLDEVFPQIVKKGGTREDFDREKIVAGVRIACKKLPISRQEVDEVVNDIERQLLEQPAREVSSDWIGARVSESLRTLDPVAYIRFASVYRAFGDIQEFLREVQKLEEESEPKETASGEGKTPPGEI